jgi:hypothetical protein
MILGGGSRLRQRALLATAHRVTGRVTRREPGGWVLRALPVPRNDDTAAQSGNGSPGDRYGVGGGRRTPPPGLPSRHPPATGVAWCVRE